MSSDGSAVTFPPPMLGQRPPARVRRKVPSASPRVLLAALAVGVFFAVAVDAEQIGLASSLLVVVVVSALMWSALMWSGGVGHPSARWLLASSVLIAPWLTLRTNVTTTIVNVSAIAALVLIAVSTGTNGRPFGSGGSPVWPKQLTNLARSAVDVWRFVGGGVQPALTESRTPRAALRVCSGRCPDSSCAPRCWRRRMPPLPRSSTRSVWAGSHTSASPRPDSVVFAAWCLTASSALPEVTRLQRRACDPHEATTVVACYGALYGLFVISRFVHPPVPVTAPELSDAARAGFFQLVAVAGITLVVLVRIRGVPRRPAR